MSDLRKALCTNLDARKILQKQTNTLDTYNTICHRFVAFASGYFQFVQISVLTVVGQGGALPGVGAHAGGGHAVLGHTARAARATRSRETRAPDAQARSGPLDVPARPSQNGQGARAAHVRYHPPFTYLIWPVSFRFVFKLLGEVSPNVL